MDILDIIIHLGGAIWVLFFGLALTLLSFDKFSGNFDDIKGLNFIFGIILFLYGISLALDLFEELGFVI